MKKLRILLCMLVVGVISIIFLIFFMFKGSDDSLKTYNEIIPKKQDSVDSLNEEEEKVYLFKAKNCKVELFLETQPYAIPSENDICTIESTETHNLKRIIESDPNVEIIFEGKQQDFGTCGFSILRIYNKETNSTHTFYGGLEGKDYDNEYLSKRIERTKLKTDTEEMTWREMMIITMNEFHEFSLEYNFLYTVAGGLLIGLCRSNRPIGWDYDIDVWIGEDYLDVFRKIFETCEPYNCSVVNNKKGMLVLYGFEKKCRVIYIKNTPYLIVNAGPDWYHFLKIFYDEEAKEFIRPYYYPAVDIFFCKKSLCKFDEYTGKLLKDSPRHPNDCLFDYKEDGKKYICAYGWLGNINTYKGMYGPYPEHRNEDFPTVNLCGMKMRLPRDFVTNRDKACKEWVDTNYKYPEVKIYPEVHKNGKYYHYDGFNTYFHHIFDFKKFQSNCDHLELDNESG